MKLNTKILLLLISHHVAFVVGVYFACEHFIPPSEARAEASEAGVRSNDLLEDERSETEQIGEGQATRALEASKRASNASLSIPGGEPGYAPGDC